MNTEAQIIAALDIGSTKVEAVIAEVTPPGPPKIIGIGTCAADGLRRGMVVDLERTTESVRTAMAEAEMMSGCSVASVVTSITGEHIRSINSKGVIAVSRQSDEITEEDIDRVVEAARALPIPQDREIIHVLPMEYLIDDQGGIKRPYGMCGSRLEAEVLIITGALTAVRNIYKSVQKAEYEIADLLLESMACGGALLRSTEQEMGVAIINLGGGVTDIAVYYDQSIRSTATLAIGGNNVTSDIAIGLRTPPEAAESIKLNHGAAVMVAEGQPESISVPGVGNRPAREISDALLTSIIEPRVEEILELTLREIKKTPYFEMLNSGIILTGGGANLPGIVEIAERIYDLPVRVGFPTGVEGMSDLTASPAHATAVGLLLHAAEHIERIDPREGGFFRRWTKRMESILNEII